MVETLTTYDELNEDIQFTEDETKALLKLSEKEILILVLSEMKKQTELMAKVKNKKSSKNYTGFKSSEKTRERIINFLILKVVPL